MLGIYEMFGSNGDMSGKLGLTVRYYVKQLGVPMEIIAIKFLHSDDRVLGIYDMSWSMVKCWENRV